MYILHDEKTGVSAAMNEGQDSVALLYAAVPLSRPSRLSMGGLSSCQ